MGRVASYGSSGPGPRAGRRQARGGGYPCEWRSPDRDVRIRVTGWRELAPIPDQFVERPASVRLVWEYLRHLGPVAVARKIASRLAEQRRNAKVSGIGVGYVSEAPSDSGLENGTPVGFFAPNHSRDPEWVVVDRRCVVETATMDPERAPEEGWQSAEDAERELLALRGWSPYSGISIDERRVAAAQKRLTGAHFSPSELPPPDGGATVATPDCRERRERARASTGRPAAVLFGLGNYAKTQIVPRARRVLDLACIHEIDPNQMVWAGRWDVSLDTSPWPRKDERYDAWFVAGFHHTHAPIAVEAMERGGYAIVEKPLATTWADYRALESTLRALPASRMIGCFQRRYTPMNAWAMTDMQATEGDPINYYAIAYEIPLPARHWYNWPNSGSRLSSNACHWVDHFLFLNGYAALVDYDARPARNGDVFVRMELGNGAVFFLVLTEKGSARLGVRDYVELRGNGVTVRMIDQSLYEAEDGGRRLRRRRVNPTWVYGRMYGHAAERVLRGDEGDAMRTLASTQASLLLEDALAASGGQRSARSFSDETAAVAAPGRHS